MCIGTSVYDWSICALHLGAKLCYLVLFCYQKGISVHSSLNQKVASGCSFLDQCGICILFLGSVCTFVDQSVVSECSFWDQSCIWMQFLGSVWYLSAYFLIRVWYISVVSECSFLDQSITVLFCDPESGIWVLTLSPENSSWDQSDASVQSCWDQSEASVQSCWDQCATCPRFLGS